MGLVERSSWSIDAALPRVRTISAVVVLQGILQVLNFASGILIVNLFSKEEYARYAICVSVASMGTVLINAGLYSSISSQGARLLANRHMFAEVVVSTLAAGKILKRAVLVVLCGGQTYLMVRSGLGAAEALLLSASNCIVISTATRASVSDTVAVLIRRPNRVQASSIAAGVTRVAIALLMQFRSLSSLILLQMVNIGTSLLRVEMQRSTVRTAMEPGASINGAYRRQAQNIIYRLLPSTVYMVIQAQIMILVLGALGSTDILAEISAVGRYGVVYVVLASLWGFLITPGIARSNERELTKRILRGSLVVFAGTLTISIGLIAMESQLLGLLGEGYRHSTVLKIVVAGAALATLSDYLSAVNETRGWVGILWLQVPFSIVILVIAAIWFVDWRNAREVASLAALMAVPRLIVNTAQLLRGIADERRRSSITSSEASERTGDSRDAQGRGTDHDIQVGLAGAGHSQRSTPNDG